MSDKYLEDRMHFAVYLCGLFENEHDCKLLGSDSFEDGYNEMLNVFETTEPIVLKKQFIEIVESCRNKTKGLNEMHIKMKTDAEYRAKVIASIGIAEGELAGRK